jgi:hypothetical protein
MMPDGRNLARFWRANGSPTAVTLQCVLKVVQRTSDAITRAPRQGRAGASKTIALASDDALMMSEF